MDEQEKTPVSDGLLDFYIFYAAAQVARDYGYMHLMPDDFVNMQNAPIEEWAGKYLSPTLFPEFVRTQTRIERRNANPTDADIQKMPQLKPKEKPEQKRSGLPITELEKQIMPTELQDQINRGLAENEARVKAFLGDKDAIKNVAAMREFVYLSERMPEKVGEFASLFLQKEPTTVVCDACKEIKEGYRLGVALCCECYSLALGLEMEDGRPSVRKFNDTIKNLTGKIQEHITDSEDAVELDIPVITKLTQKPEKTITLELNEDQVQRLVSLGFMARIGTGKNTRADYEAYRVTTDPIDSFVAGLYCGDRERRDKLLEVLRMDDDAVRHVLVLLGLPAGPDGKEDDGEH